MPPCPWSTSSPAMRAYHDREWGLPCHDDARLFEFLLLEGAQAGLSWATVLRKRPAYAAAFASFDPAKLARFTDARLEGLLAAPAPGSKPTRESAETIVRNRAKVFSARQNARAFLLVQREFGSFDEYIWRFVGGAPIVNRRRSAKDVPAVTPESEAMSKDLKRRGFNFVGPTICYAYMQAVGMVNDHLTTCPRHAACAKRR